ncbi:MAG: DNA/RNA non-specific endonuclease [Planococcus citreus]
MNVWIAVLLAAFMAGCTDTEQAAVTEPETEAQEKAPDEAEVEETPAETEAPEESTEETSANDTEQADTTVEDEPEAEEPVAEPVEEQFEGYELVEVDGGDLSGHREANTVVSVGYGDREYWAFTNEHGQLERVIADEIVLQDEINEPVLESGRYYSDEAKVPGVESDILDEGHVIADSLGGVSNAYNITPQESTLNRHGDQAYMEDVIRDAGGATDFEAIITYPDTETQVPSSYQYSYTVRGNEVVDTFDNVNPDEVNASLGLTDSEPAEAEASPPETSSPEASGDVSSVDANGNGQVTIQEAKDAGFTMPIMSDHWLYPHMRDNDNDGMVGE